MGKWKKLKFVNFLDTFLAGTTYCSYIRKENSFNYKENMQQQQKKGRKIFRVHTVGWYKSSFCTVDLLHTFGYKDYTQTTHSTPRQSSEIHCQRTYYGYTTIL